MAPESVLRLSRQCTKDIWSAHSILVNGTSTMTMLKEISSNRNCQTMDVIAPCSPSWSTRFPHLVPLLLEPVFRYIATRLSPHLTLATITQNCRRTTQTVDANGGWHNIEQTGLLLGGTPDELVQYQLAWKALPTSWYQLVQLAGRYSRPAGTACWEVLPTSWYSSLGGNPNQLVQLAGGHSQQAVTVPNRWEALILTSWYSTNSLGGTPKELVNTSSLGGTPDKLVQYQLAGRHSRRAGTVPTCWEALPTSWYSTKLLGGTPDKLVQYQLAGRHSRQSGTVPTRWEALPTSWCTSSLLKGTPDQLKQY
ncbi:hypothetical protein PCANC_00800 [Puccinia coronata f. sp. avenae]|uniref:Glutaminase A central domain-containing protein n=1 Tax=Puccinia coronata f. sp. avenae TaxID=200324 RepID=A0A2N5W7T4_9BASI|nr:hypothetical protein PCANC_00800 [Puccinia coronata f. sp. avenae]